jgi:signal transduction histidine kinase
LADEERERCRVEMQEALSDLRRALERPLAPLPAETGTTLSAELDRIAGGLPQRLRVSWPADVAVPEELEALAQSVLSEALRNIAKHASASTIDVGVSRDEDTFMLEIRNDGVRGGTRGAGMGLRIAAFEALQHEGVVEFGPTEPSGWRVRLVVPLRRGNGAA